MSPYGDDFDLGVVLDRPLPVHKCAPPLMDVMMTPPHGPGVGATVSREEREAFEAAGCRHWSLTDRLAWGLSCPVHPLPQAAKVGTRAVGQPGTLWRCHDCGTVWIVDYYRTPPTRGGYYAGGWPKWYRATRRQRRALRPSFRARLIARLRGV